MSGHAAPSPAAPPGLLDRVIRFCLEQKLVVALLVVFIVAWGVMVAPFDWNIAWLPRRPVAVDAIPNIGENQQIVFADWMGRSPKDVDDQVTYPLTVALLGTPGVRTVRSSSMFGFSILFVIFDEGVGFETAQNRIVARLNGLPEGTLPEGVKPALGPFATALGQVFWYTIEGRDPDGRPAGGWDLHELRSVQDWTLRYHLQAVEGVAEVASVGGFVQEYQVDADPDALRIHNVALHELFAAVRQSNADVGARQIELNGVEYFIRARGFVRSLTDIENTVVKVNANVPIYVRNVATVGLGPAYRDGALDKEGAEAVGAVVVARNGFNPLEAIRNVKARIAEIGPTLPAKAVADYGRVSRAELEAFGARHGFAAFAGGGLNQEAWLAWLRATPRKQWPQGVTLSQLTIVPFYDRTGLIYETLGTLNAALYEQILITTIVILIMTFHLSSSALIAAVMPLSVLLSFITMKIAGVDANLVSLSGIAIAIGTIVDMGIVITDNIRHHLAAAPDDPPLEAVYRASSEVGSAVLTATLTTVIGFLPVFLMTGPEGRLFKPLAFTKTFCLLASVVVALTVIPAAAQILFTARAGSDRSRKAAGAALIVAGLALGFWPGWWMAAALTLASGAYIVFRPAVPARLRAWAPFCLNAAVIVFVAVLLTAHWMPLGPGKGLLRNTLLVAAMIAVLQGFYYLVHRLYPRLIRVFLDHKIAFACIPLCILLAGYTGWLGFDAVFGVLPRALGRISPRAERWVRGTDTWRAAYHRFPGFGREFMPPLDEGSFLYMPTTMPHASIGEALDIVQKQDMALRAIPEVDRVVGKIGRAASALDPAPVNMVETIVSYKPEYATDRDGRLLRFRYDRALDRFARDAAGNLVPDPRGRPWRQWRDAIRTPDDIWREIAAAAEIPGSTTAPRLQPIAARMVMLQSGMRAPMGVKVSGPDLASIEKAGIAIERLLKEVPSVEASTVIADRIVGKPYIEISVNREALARFGIRVADVHEVIEVALGGIRLTTTVEGRARYPVRVRYLRELRDNVEAIGKVLVPGMEGVQIPLAQLADIRYARGPEAVRSEDGFLVSYVLLDKKPGHAEVDVVEACRRHLAAMQDSGELQLPPGVSYRFAGAYENQLHAQKTLAVVLPAAFFAIFMIIYFQFRSVVTTGIVFCTIFVCWGGGLLLIWLYAQPWFLDVAVFGVSLRDLFHVHAVNMSVAVWVGFLALFGIASDDAVLVCTYLDQRFAEVRPRTVPEVREAVAYAGQRRVRACLMTTATTVLALLPVLTSSGRGSDLMLPMSLPSFGGMLAEVFVMFVAAVLYCAVKERQLRATKPAVPGALRD